MSLRRAMLVFVLLTVVLYVVFVPLVVWLLDVDNRAMALAGLSGFMLLPLTNVATHLQFHPYTLTVFFVPLVVYLLLRYIPVSPEDQHLPGGISPAGLLFVPTLVSLILFHPQPAVNVLILLVGIAIVQWYRRRKMPTVAAEQLRSVAGVTVLFGVALFLWVLPHEKFYALLFGLVDSMIEAVEGSETVGENVQQRGGSLQDLGVSLQEMFLRLFLAQAVYVGLTTVVVLTNLLGSVRESKPATSTTVSYLFVGGVALLPFFLFHFVGDISSFFFRHVGFGMTLVTLIGALGLSFFSTGVEQSRHRPVLQSVLGVALVVLLVLSVLTMFPSPFLYKANQHVTAGQLDGHEQAFETAAPGVEFAGIRTGPSRYVDAHRAPERLEAGDVLPPVVLNTGNLTTHYREPQYVLVTTADVQREVQSFDELRYSKHGFERLGTQAGVSHVRTNGGLDIYYVQPRSKRERTPVESDPCFFPDQAIPLPFGRPRCQASVVAAVGPAALVQPSSGRNVTTGRNQTASNRSLSAANLPRNGSRNRTTGARFRNESGISTNSGNGTGAREPGRNETPGTKSSQQSRIVGTSLGGSSEASRHNELVAAKRYRPHGPRQQVDSYRRATRAGVRVPRRARESRDDHAKLA
jgi:hypothetical protein